MLFIEKRLSQKTSGARQPFKHSMEEKARNSHTLDAANQNSALGKQKMAKIANGLKAMDTVASEEDFKTLKAAYGSTEVSALQAAHKVCRRLETLLKARLVFLQRQCAMAVVKSDKMTPNSLEARHNALGDAVTAAPTGERLIEGFKESFYLPPKNDFWSAARDGSLGAAAADEMATGGTAAAAVPTEPAGGAGGGGKKRSRESDAAAAAAEAARREEVVRKDAVANGLRAAATASLGSERERKGETSIFAGFF